MNRVADSIAKSAAKFAPVHPGAYAIFFRTEFLKDKSFWPGGTV